MQGRLSLPIRRDDLPDAEFLRPQRWNRTIVREARDLPEARSDTSQNAVYGQPRALSGGGMTTRSFPEALHRAFTGKIDFPRLRMTPTLSTAKERGL